MDMHQNARTDPILLDAATNKESPGCIHGGKAISALRNHIDIAQGGGNCAHRDDCHPAFFPQRQLYSTGHDSWRSSPPARFLTGGSHRKAKLFW